MAQLNIINRIRDALPGGTIKDEGEKASVPGLHVRILPSKRVFMLYYRTKQGVQRRPRLGDFGPMTLGQARAVAKTILDRVARGEDPQGDWNDARSEMTVSELFAHSWASHWDKPRYIDSGWARDVKNLFDRNIKNQLGSYRLSALKREHVIEWHAGFEAVPFAGNRSLEVLTTMFNLAELKGLTPRNTSPCWKVKGFTEKKRKRYASVEEMSRILMILHREKRDNPRAVAFLFLILYTGSRPSALERATWDQLSRAEYDGETMGVLTFAGKGSAESGEEETVIIPPEALAMIDALPRAKNNLILGIKNPRRFWVQVRDEAGCQDLWARDLRRTFATVGMSGGVNKDVIGELLNHSSAETTGIYAQLDMSARMNASSMITDRIKSLTNVVPLRRALTQSADYRDGETPRPR